jgi:uncharacterized alpha-E superfamily protein
MPGGLTRVAPSDDVARISSQAGAISKDTWVLASEPERLTGFWLDSGPTVRRIDPMASIPSRAAENLWWLGRYAERAEAITRLLRVVYDRRNDFQRSTNQAGIESLRALLVATTHTTTTYPGFVGSGAEQRLESPGRELLDLVVDERRPGTLAHSVRSLLDSAYAVRDQLSADTWLVVGALDREILELHGPMHDPQAVVSGALARVMQSLLALSGLSNESMVRDLGWRFMDAGARLERGVQLLSLLHTTVTDSRGTATDSLLLESVLTAAESIITYRRRYRSRAQLETLLDLLLLDDGNPRSLVFGLDRLREDLDAFPVAPDGRLREEQRLVLEASTALRLADTEALAVQDGSANRPALDAFLMELRGKLLDAADAVDRGHFVHVLPRSSLVGPADSGVPAGGEG